jgi:hypothetical protein
MGYEISGIWNSQGTTTSKVDRGNRRKRYQKCVKGHKPNHIRIHRLHLMQNVIGVDDSELS